MKRCSQTSARCGTLAGPTPVPATATRLPAASTLDADQLVEILGEAALERLLHDDPLPGRDCPAALTWFTGSSVALALRP